MSQKSPSYYGGFFWLTLTTFVVPLFVAFAAFSKITPATKPSPAPDVSGVDHNLWDYLLRTYVENGLVDYGGLSKDYLFTTYLRQLAACEPDKLATDAERLALHINAYNALVMHGVINHKIYRNEKNVLNYSPPDVAAELARLDRAVEALKRRPESEPVQIERLVEQADRLRADSQFFQLQEHLFANRTITLDHLEHGIIRPTFGDPRVHVALVCAAKSCPAIRPEAYVGPRIEQQLEDQADLFANDRRYVGFDDEGESLLLSPILKWYGVDWEPAGGYLAWLVPRVTDQRLRTALAAAADGQFEVRFADYDWSLNSTANSLAASPAAGGGFGSGSVPNE